MLENSRFLVSALDSRSGYKSINELLSWVKTQNDKVHVEIRETLFENLTKWRFNKSEGQIEHESGKFFTIEGIEVTTNWGAKPTWDQPIINQPEIGYLGFIVKEFSGILHFLVQAKIEPGNINQVQISPTIQATKSNYTRVHKGKKPEYLEYFLNVRPENVLLDQLQSEQGARFLRKRNRNIIIEVVEEIELKENFTWATLGQIKSLLSIDNIVNMDTRTVISGIPYFQNESKFELVLKNIGSDNLSEFGEMILNSYLSKSKAKYSIDDIIKWITALKCRYDLNVKKKPLKGLEDWIYTEQRIYHVDNKYFEVIPVDVIINNREVVGWSQPLVKPAHQGLCALVGKVINGVLHFIVQAKLECGNLDILEMAPTVQCITENYKNYPESNLPFIKRVLISTKDEIVIDTLQSEEGGRFFREENRNLIVILDDIDNELPDNYIWMTLEQLHYFLKFNNYLNIQLRSLISLLNFNE